MTDPRAWLINYLSARGDTPWRWTDDGNVITWTDGTTICFREEIIFILEWLAPQGWPPFGSLIWLLAACRDKLPSTFNLPNQQAQPANHKQEPHTISQDSSAKDFATQIRAMHSQIESGLSHIARLPTELRASLKAKAVLAETVFGQFSMPPEQRAMLLPALDFLRSGTLTDDMLNAPDTPPARKNQEWTSLYFGLSQIDPDSLALRLQTGLDALPQAAELPQTQAEQLRALLTELQKDSEYAGIARLTRDFMAALQMPRNLSEPDDLPIGGFSDLANRGNLDRLVLSELAHDDLTLAVRIALGEALYLRREPPVKQPPSTLVILIDAGVRLWGVPRVLATSLALAFIIKRGAHHTETSIFRASASEITPTTLTTKAGIIAHLSALEPHAHPGLALPAFQSALKSLENTEAVLITHPDTLADPDFQRALAHSHFDTLYLATVDRDGLFELSRYPHHNQPLSRAKISLEDLWPKPSTTSTRRPSLIDRKIHPDLPLALSVDPFPLLLPVSGSIQSSIQTPDHGNFCVLRERRLLHWDSTRRGARTLAENLPRGTTLWFDKLPDQKIVLLKQCDGAKLLSCCIFDPSGDLLHSYELRVADPIQQVEIAGSILYVFYQINASAHDLHTGKQLGQITLDSFGSNSRYFCNSLGEWSILIWDSLSLKLEPVTLPYAIDQKNILKLFNRQGYEGPWAITRQGEILSNDGNKIYQISNLHRVFKISQNGNLLEIGPLNRRVDKQNPSTQYKILDLETLKETYGQHRETAYNIEPITPAPVRNLTKSFTRINIDSSGSLLLYSRKRGWSKLTLESNNRLILTKTTSSSINLQDGMPFSPVSIPNSLGFSLYSALWADGRCAWVDNRGLLHLRCANRSLPEICLVLDLDNIAGWTSDGCWSGPEFFIGDHPASNPTDLWARIQNFTSPAP